MMTEAKFWELVTFVGWPCDTDKAKHRLMQKYTKEELDEAITISGIFAKQLYKLVEEKIEAKGGSLGLGDDSFSDLMRHIVGLGKEEYEKHLKNVNLIQKRADKGDFEECFTYCFPHDRDWEMANPTTAKAYFTNWADELKTQIKNILEMDTANLLHDFHPFLENLYATINLIKQDNFEEFVNQWEAQNFTKQIKEFINQWEAQNFTKQIKEFIKWVKTNEDELPHKYHKFFSPHVVSENVFCEHAYHNLYNDVKEWMPFWANK